MVCSWTMRRKERIETIHGERGRLSLAADRTVDVGYEVRVYQEFVDGVPLLKSADGDLKGLAHEDAVRAIIDGKPLELYLEDGRTTKLILTDLDGTFGVIGPIG